MFGLSTAFASSALGLGSSVSASLQQAGNIDYKISCRGRKPLANARYSIGTPVNALFTSLTTGKKHKRRVVRVAGSYYIEDPSGWRNCRKLAKQYGYDFDVLGRFGRKEG